MSAHTPGPWVAELAVSQNGMHEVRAGAVNARERPLIGYVTAEHRSIVSAAPDLLAALKDAARWINLLPAEIRDGSIMPEKLAEVIAKAEGRS